MLVGNIIGRHNRGKISHLMSVCQLNIGKHVCCITGHYCVQMASTDQNLQLMRFIVSHQFRYKLASFKDVLWVFSYYIIVTFS